jgi:hypothetical protein
MEHEVTSDVDRIVDGTGKVQAEIPYHEYAGPPTAEQLAAEADARRSRQDAALDRVRSANKARRNEQVAAMIADRQRLENRIVDLERAVASLQNNRS